MLSLKSPTQLYILLALFGVVVLLLLTVPDKQPDLQQVLVPAVRVATVGLRDLAPVETVSGRLEPARRAELHFELSGQIHTRLVEPGQAVRQGAALLSLAAGDFEDALAETEAQLAQETRDIRRDRELLKLSKNNYALQENELERLDKLGADSLVSESRRDETRIKLIQLQADIAQLKSSVASVDSRLLLKQSARNRAARNLERARLTAPFAGSVNAVNVQVGDYVTPSQTVVELIDATSLDMYVEVRGDVAQALSHGQAVSIDLDGKLLPGEVVALQIDPDPVTFTHALRVRVTANGARPGQVAQAHLPLRAMSQVMAIPAAAVLFDEGRTFVFRLNTDTLEMVEVILGNRVGKLQVVRQGIHASDRLVIRDVSALSHGQVVQAVVTEAMPAVASD